MHPGQWAGIDTETSLLRGAGSPVSEGPTTAGSIDRELARGRVHLRRGLSISGLASRSRPARAVHGPGTTLGSVTPRHHDGRLSLRAALTAGPSAGRGAFGSPVRGRFDVIDHVSLAGETELELARRDGGQVLRTLRLTSDVALLRGTALQLLYTYRAGTPLSFGQAIEARVSRTIDLFTR